MRVLFDGFWWVEGPAANRTVQREFILAWHRAFPQDECIVAVRRGGQDAVPVGMEAVTTRMWPQAASNALELPGIARAVRADVIVTHNFAPLLGRGAVFIHDVMFVDHPAWFSPAERLYFAAMLPTARRAAVVATSTRTEATRIARVAPHLPPAVVTGLAVPSALVAADPQPPREVLDVDAFALTVGRLNVRKNLESLLAGAGQARRITPEQPLFVVGSSEHSGVASDLPAPAARMRADGRVRFLGRIDDAELAWLYANASLVVSLSRDEGFGMPPIEAAHFGAPLLVSDIAVHRETVGEIADFVAHDADPASIGAAIDAAWGSPGSHRVSPEPWSWEAAVRALRAAL